MLKSGDKKDCCGCNACGDACPKDAITFRYDEEGFLYPFIDAARCVKCGKCEQVCPHLCASGLKGNEYSSPECIAANHINTDIRMDSTSGGVFTALAEAIFEKGGYVCGAIYTESWGVRWFLTNDRATLPKLRSSKYIQSDSRGMYCCIKKVLSSGKLLLVCGLPCQIAAIRCFLGRDYNNLILIDLICRYINSPLAFRKYLDSLERESGGTTVYIKAKNKELGWRKLTHKYVFDNGTSYYRTKDDDIFLKASMRLNCVSRPSCYSCAFKGFPRYGDITIGDYWTRQGNCSLDDDKGTSVVMLNSKKGESFFDKAKKALVTENVVFDEVLKGNPALVASLPRSSVDRRRFFARILSEDFQVVVNDMAAAVQKKDRTLVRRIRKLLGRICRRLFF